MNALQLAISVARHAKFEKPKPIAPAPIPAETVSECHDSTEALRQYCQELEQRLQAYEGMPSEYVLKTGAIMRLICETYRITRSMMLSHRRNYRIILPRHIAMYLCVEKTTLSLPVVGRIFGGKDHTTVMHAHRKIAALRIRDARFDAEITGYEKQLAEMVS